MTEKMPIKQIIVRLKYWKARCQKLEAQLEAFRALTDAAVDSKLLDSIYRVTEDYTVAVGELVGDKNEWLLWYQYDCEMGRKPLDAEIKGKAVKVKTLRKLARVISYD